MGDVTVLNRSLTSCDKEKGCFLYLREAAFLLIIMSMSDDYFTTIGL